MCNVVNFKKDLGKIKPMHAVNNGPVKAFYRYSNDLNSNVDAFLDAGIPYVRTNAPTFFFGYSENHTIDVSAVFPNFENDETLEDSYDFSCTDTYFKVIELSGAKPFYRLGNRKEYWSKKYKIFPPKDFSKWARICEHIIRHYTEGWADGFYYDIKYWEIWDEPDLMCDDYKNSPSWQGTKEEFFRFYGVVAKHLKNCFPKLKIGGPAVSGNLVWTEEFLKSINAPLDFFSWYSFTDNPMFFKEVSANIRNLLDKYGYKNTESINCGWNYTSGYSDEDEIYSIETRTKLKGSSFLTASMCVSQYSDTDMMMYYNAAPSKYNGMFDNFLYCDCLKGYYPFKMFNELYMLGGAVSVKTQEDIFVCAAKAGSRAAIILTHFEDDETASKKNIQLKLEGLSGKVKAEYYLLDDSHDLELVKEEMLKDDFFVSLDMRLYSSYLIILTCEGEK